MVEAVAAGEGRQLLIIEDLMDQVGGNVVVTLHRGTGEDHLIEEVRHLEENMIIVVTTPEVVPGVLGGIGTVAAEVAAAPPASSQVLAQRVGYDRSPAGKVVNALEVKALASTIAERKSVLMEEAENVEEVALESGVVPGGEMKAEGLEAAAAGNPSVAALLPRQPLLLRRPLPPRNKNLWVPKRKTRFSRKTSARCLYRSLLCEQRRRTLDVISRRR